MKILIVIAVILAIAVWLTHSDLVAKRNRVEAAYVELNRHEEGSRDYDNACKYYNGVVREFNNSVEKFPGSVIAGTFGFQIIPVIEVSSDEDSTEEK